MIGFMISAAEIRSAPLAVRIWLEQRSMPVSGKSVAPDRLPGYSASSPAHKWSEPQSGAATGSGSAVPKRVPDESPLLLKTSEARGHDEALRKLIAARAYKIWESQGRPHGCDLTHWHQAEQEIMDCVRRNLQSGGGSYIARPTAD
jgi:hypothetical protein